MAARIWQAHFPGIITQTQIDWLLPRSYAPAVVAAELARGVAWEWVLGPEGQGPLGFLSYGPAKDDVMPVHKLFLDVSARGRGLGRAMLERVVDAAGGARASRLRLTVNRRNTGPIRAYVRFGFRITESIDIATEAGFVLADFVMECELDAGA